MIKSILLVFFITFSTHANYSYFHFNEKKVNVSKSSFNRYIYPQAKAIVTEFYHLLKKFHPYHGELLEVKRLIRLQKKKWRHLQISCPKEEVETCRKIITDLYDLSKKVDIKILKTIEKAPKLDSFKDGNKRDALLSTLSHLKYVSSMNYKFVHFLEEFLMSNETIYENFSHADKHFDSILHKSEIKLNLTYSSLLPSRFKRVFENAWNNFIKPLEDKVIEERNFKYLTANLESLNISWNTFHMKTEKGDLSVPRKQVNTIKIMHNRWNAILKVILRR